MRKTAFAVAVATALVTTSAVQAAPTNVFANPQEGNLTDVLDGIYGAGNFQRVDDNTDTIWAPQMFGSTNAPSNASVVFQRKVGDDSVGFGWSQGSTYNEIFAPVSGNGSSPTPSNATVALSALAPSFTWTLDAAQGTFSSNDSLNPLPDNPGNTPTVNPRDHMVTYLVTGGSAFQADRDTYILAWEDRFKGGFADFDFQDYIVQADAVVPVPVPATLALLGLGLIGLGAAARRR